MLKVLSASAGSDTAGIGVGLVGAFADSDAIELRSVARRTNFLDYPVDLEWELADRLWDTADVVHVHGNFKAHRLLTGAGHAAKPIVLHHHGTKYRRDSAIYDAAVAGHAPGAVAVAATLDLLDIGPHLTWVPHPVDIEALAGHRNLARGKRKLRVGHSPTNRAAKSTEAFLAACKRVDVEPVLIEGQSWAECLRIKGTCDALFDQVTYGYGVSAIEAWAMGLPVVAGGTTSTLDRMRETFGELPFIAATEATIADALDQLTDTKTRATWGRKGKAHAKRWHDGRETVERLTPIYQHLA